MSRNIYIVPCFTKKALLISASTYLLAIPSVLAQESETAVNITAKEISTKNALKNTAITPNTASTGMQADQDTYPASFFDQYTPQNAMDMINRLPGFSFDAGSNVRGFGGAAGNVLIDDARPTSKSGGLRSALQRIPAAQVERIIILRGGVSAGEAAGQSVVANIIRKASGSSGTWKATVRRSPVSHTLHPQIQGTITSKLGAWDTSFDLNTGTEGRYRVAKIIERDTSGNIVDTNDENNINKQKWFILSTEASRAVANGKLTLNGRIDRFHGDTNTDRTGYIGRLSSSTNDTFWHLGEITDSLETEFGLTWNRTFSNGWRWNVIGLMNLNNRDYKSKTTDNDLVLNTSSIDDYIQNKDKSELIARTTYGKTIGALKPEFGIEVTQNKLTNHIEDSPGGVFNAAGSENVTVKELRGEAFATLVYQAAPNLTLESGLTFEASRINVTGDATQEQKFKFLKPRLSSTYSFNNDMQLTLEAERTVGQLDLDDFGASQQAADDRTRAGNPNLRPAKTTKVGAVFDWQFSARGSLKVEAFHEWRSDILEQIILPSGDEGTGNAGNARFWVIKTDLNLPLDVVLPGGLIEIKHFYRRSRFKDPVLDSANRTISWYTPNWLRFDFRQDLTAHKFAWGISYFGSFKDRGFRVSEIEEFRGNKRLRFFAETTRFFGVKTRLEISQMNTGKYQRTRYFYDGNRAGTFTGTEVSNRKRYPEFKIEISGTF